MLREHRRRPVTEDTEMTMAQAVIAQDKVQALIPLEWARDVWRLSMVSRLLEQTAYDRYGHRRWTLGPVAYNASLMLPYGVFLGPDRLHELDGAAATEDTLDALLQRLVATELRWEIAVTAEVIPSVRD